MATTARLGIDIVGHNRTGGAFDEVEHKLKGIERATRMVSKAFELFGVFTAIDQVVGPLIEVNRNLAPVEESFKKVDRAFQAFALRVGESGLNDGLETFNAALARAYVSGNSAADLLGGAFLTALSDVATAMDYASRATGFFADNIDKLKRKLDSVSPEMESFVASVLTNSNPIWLAGSTLHKFIASGGGKLAIDAMQSIGIETGALTVATGKLDREVAHLGKTFKEMHEAASGRGARRGGMSEFEKLVKLGDKWRDATRTPLEQYKSQLQELNVLLDEGAIGQTTYARALEKIGADFVKAGAAMEKTKTPLEEFHAGLQKIDEGIGDKFSSALDDIVTGAKSVTAAFKDMVGSILSDLLRLEVNSIFKDLFGGGGGPLQFLFGGGGGGLYSPVTAGGPVAIPARGGGGMRVEIHNYAGAPVTTRESRGPDGERILKAMIGDEVNRQVPRLLTSQYGISPAQRRR
jgi:hypothetical protein